MQAIFSIKNGIVICQADGQCYTDSVENFLSDFGSQIPSDVKEIDYNKSLGNCFINGVAFQPFPNEFAESALAAVPALCEAFEARKAKQEDADRVEREKAETEEAERKEAERIASMTEEERLIEQYEEEIAKKEQWLREHDYIGVKIATGRATIDDYPEEIATMTEYAKRIEELRETIASLSN